MERQKLKLAFSEVIEGYSVAISDSFGDIRIKHINNSDSAKTDIKNNFYYEKAISDGLPKREEQINYLIKENLWSKEKDKEIDRLRDYIAGMNKTKSKLVLQAQIDQLKKEIIQNENDLQKLVHEKESIIGFTAEEYANRKINEYYMQISVLRPDGTNMFTEEEFDELDQKYVYEIMGVYNQNIKKFVAENLKRMALADFFTNIFYLCEDNIYNFYGKPIVKLTFYQIELFSFGRYFKSIIQNSEEKVPEHIIEDPEKLIEWAESSKNVKEMLEKSSTEGKDGAASSIVGATQKDLEKAGIDNSSDVIDLSQKAKEKGGKLTMEDMMKLHGVK